MNISFKSHIRKKDLRVFGYIWTLIFTFVAIYPVFYNEEFRLWALITASVFFVITTILPFVLKYFYVVWVFVGEIIGNIISRIALFLIFFLLITPMALVMKLIGKDPLNRKLDNSETYWINRDQQPGSMKNQF